MNRLVKLRFNVVPAEDIIIPPFSSKVSKTILIRVIPELESLFNEKEAVKPIVTSPIFREGKPLVKYKDGEDKPLALFSNTPYYFETTLIGDLTFKLTDILTNLIDRKVEVYNGKIRIADVQVEVKSFDQLSFPSSSYVRFDFLTPILLTLPLSKEKYGYVRHFLFPHPYLMFYSLIMHWNKFAPRENIILAPSKLARYGYYTLLEADYDIQPKTVIYDSSRKPRGFVGWAIFERKTKKRKYDLLISKLLDYANYVGIGRSRTIGFGKVIIKPA